jgi:NAD(P)-dependent dehydrogenase (short-subunit alcohol dehydrogenase family)
MTRAIAVVIGAHGGVGGALRAALQDTGAYDAVLGFGRPAFDLLDEASIAQGAAEIGAAGTPRLVVVATGALHEPEKTVRALDADRLARAFAINTIGPALVMKHLLPLLPRQGRSVFAALSARVGSIGDNHLGGWYGYRAAKAALNQMLRTAAIELARTHPQAICVALHPGTVTTRLSAPFLRPGQTAHTAPESAGHLLSVIDRLRPEDTGGFLDWRGAPIPW